MTAMLVLFALAVAAVVCIIILDTVSLRGKDYTLSQRKERYKVACQFLWADFKETVSRKKTSETEIVSCPAELPESEPDAEP